MIQSGYSRGGMALEQAIPETEALRKYFVQHYGKPSESYVTGHSMGGTLTAMTIEQHPEIYDVAVFGIPSEEWGEVVHATVVRSPGSLLTGEEVTAFAREHLASYKVPRSVDFTGELPRTGSGKLLKRQLRAPYWAGRTAQVG